MRRLLNIEGHPVFVRESGEGVPVLLVHGLASTSHSFEPLFALAPTGLRLIAVDLPGWGETAPFCDLSLPAVTRALESVMEVLELDGALVAGHSFGGLVALELARRCPERVRGVVLANAPAYGLPGPLQTLFQRVSAEWVARLLSRLPRSSFAVRSYLRRTVGNGSRFTEQQVRGYIEAARSPDYFPMVFDGLRAIACYRFSPEAHKRTGVATRVLWGEKDPLLPATQAERLAIALEAPLKIVPGAGHFVPEEHPEVLGDVLLELADSVLNERSFPVRPPRHALAYGVGAFH